MQYNDPDSKVSGITSFKLENKELLESVLVTLAERSNMTLRGDMYVKKKPEDISKTTAELQSHKKHKRHKGFCRSFVPFCVTLN